MNQKDADQEPTHAAMLPFTRNVFDPMDFTPVVLDRIRAIERRTTSAFELALSVLFTSGIQHYAEIPDGMAKMPAYVRDFMKHVPACGTTRSSSTATRARFVVLARRGGGRWFVAGINGEPLAKTVTLDLRELPAATSGRLITDGGEGNLSFQRSAIRFTARRTMQIVMAPRGGFVLTVDAKPTE